MKKKILSIVLHRNSDAMFVFVLNDQVIVF